jgi:hypothetical protein
MGIDALVLSGDVGFRWQVGSLQHMEKSTEMPHRMHCNRKAQCLTMTPLPSPLCCSPPCP